MQLKNLVVNIFKKELPKMGAKLLMEGDYEHAGLITFANGKKMFFRSERFNINSPGSIEISTDKRYSHFFLRSFGYNTPIGDVFFSSILTERINSEKNINAGYSYAQDLGFPVIIKPNNLSKGRLVTKVENKREYYNAAKAILKYNHVMIVEKFYIGNDYRIIVFNEKVFAAYRREPFSIIGNGKKTIHRLLKEKQEEFKIAELCGLDIYDSRIKARLKKLKLDYDSIIPKNKTLQLLEIANISSGGSIHDLTESIHSDYNDLAINVARSMQLNLCGIDIISNDICNPLSEYIILEINSSPALTHYASIGKLQLKKTEILYIEILKMMESTTLY